jgi:hypothetical protein
MAPRVQIHLSTAFGTTLLIAVLMHLNFTPVDIGRIWSDYHYGWPLLFKSDDPNYKFVVDVFVAIILPVLFVRGCEAWIRWSAVAGPQATERVKQARSTLERLKSASGKNFSNAGPGDSETSAGRTLQFRLTSMIVAALTVVALLICNLAVAKLPSTVWESGLPLFDCPQFRFPGVLFINALFNLCFCALTGAITEVVIRRRETRES